VLSHDPRIIFETLRDHLAKHDKPIGFLFGAGTSSAVRINDGSGKSVSLIPDIAGLTAHCTVVIAEFREDFGLAWTAIMEECEGEGVPVHLENILTKIEQKHDAVHTAELIGLNKEDLASLAEEVRKIVSAKVQPAPDAIPDHLPHDDFALWVTHAEREFPIEIFTTNYDVLTERSLEKAGIPVFDGFIGSYKPFFSPDSLSRSNVAPGERWVRLWKLHGSVNWSLDSHARTSGVVRREPNEIGEMIHPSLRKYDRSRIQPYAALMDRLRRFLDQPDSLLISLGYSFGDQHINDILFETLTNRPRTTMVALQFTDPDDDGDLAKSAEILPNLWVLAPRVAWIRGSKGVWQLREPVTESTSGLIDLGFDSDAIDPEAASDTPWTGQSRLGDFNRMCRFLRTMTVGNN